MDNPNLSFETSIFIAAPRSRREWRTPSCGAISIGQALAKPGAWAR